MVKWKQCPPIVADLMVILCLSGGCDPKWKFSIIGKMKEKGSLKPLEGAALLLSAPGESPPSLARRVSGPDGDFDLPWYHRAMQRKGGAAWSLKVEKKGYKPELIKIHPGGYYERVEFLVLLEPLDEGTN